MKTACLFVFIIIVFLSTPVKSQNCNNWLKLPNQPSYVRIGDLDISGNQLTVEANPFDNLINKQGNPAWDGTLGGSATINQTNPNCSFIADSCGIQQVNVVPSFTIPDTVCVGNPVTITNTSTNASSYYWNFCAPDVNTTPLAVNIGNPGSFLSQPVFMDLAEENGNYYGFVVNHFPGGLTRLDFGNSLLNTPTAVFLGNPGNALNQGYGSEGIQIVKANGKWYGIVVGGNPTSPGSVVRMVIISFGTNISNPAPTAVDYGNIGNMLQSIDLHVFQEGGNWYGFTVNAENNTITRFDFTSSFDNPPTAVNLGNIGNLSYPTGVFAVNDNGFWRVFVTNANSASLTRLDFGNSLLNTPVGVNLGNPGNVLDLPRDITIIKYCGQDVGFVVNSSNQLVRLNFSTLTNIPSGTVLGNLGNFNFPHSLSKLFRAGNDIYSFATNVNNNTITRLKFTGCTSSSISSSTQQNPSPIVYNTPGIYTINLTVDDGLPTQAATCKQVVVLATPAHSPTQNLSICPGTSIKIGSPVRSVTYVWNTGATTDSIIVNAPGTYWIQSDRYGCVVRDSFIVTINPSTPANIFNSDTTIFAGDIVQLNGFSPSGTYYWSGNNLNCTTCSNPIVSPQISTTYILNGANICGTSIDSVRVTVITRTSSPCDGFQLALGTSDYTRGYDIIPSINNEFFAVGVTRSNANDDILVTKLDLTGTILWSKTFGGSNEESVRKIINASDGGIVIIGQTKSFGNSSGDILCFKVSNNGSLAWSRKFGVGSPFGDLGMDVIETTDGGYTLSGILNVNGGVADGVVIKLDNATNVVWSKRFDRFDGEDGVGIVQKGDTLIIATDLQHSSAQYSFAVTKLRLADGNFITAKEYIPSSRGLFNPYLIKNPFRPGYIVSGHMIDGTSYSNMKHTILTLDDDLDLVSAKLISFSSVTNDFFTGIVPFGDGSFVACASPQTNADGYFYKINNDNSIAYSKRFNASTDRRLYRITSSGNRILAVGGALINASEEMFITNFNNDGTMGSDCDLENVPLTVQQPVFSVNSFSWPSITNVSFSNINISFLENTVTLTKTDLCPRPAIDFSFQQNMCSPNTVQFVTNLSGVQSFQWNFGNNQTNSNSQNPTVIYSALGSYNVKLTVQYSGGCTDSLMKTITVTNIFDDALILNTDTTICLGDSIGLNVASNALKFCWKASSGLTPTILNGYVRPDVTTTYVLTSQLVGNNLISNGDFSAGNTGFTSQYVYNTSSGFADGVYNVGANIPAWHPGMSNCNDHTSGNGSMMMVNGSTQLNANIWTTTIPVQPNTNYVFYAWLQTITTINPAQLQFSINGTSIGNVFNANPQSCIWDQFSATWNSGNNISATISIVNRNQVFSGNDFALDDIFFGEMTTKTDSFTVNVTGLCDSVKITGPDKICSPTDTLTYSIFRSPNCAQQFNLQVDAAYANIVSQAPDAVKLTFKKNGVTLIKVTYANACKVVIDSLAVDVRFSPPAINFGADITTCRDTLFTLNAGNGFVSYTWQDGTTDSISLVNTPGIYYVTAQNLCGSQLTDTFQLIRSAVIPFTVQPQVATVCKGDSVQFMAMGGSVYSWSPAVNFSNPSSSSPKAIVSSTQNLSVFISDPVCVRDTTIIIPVTASSGPSITVLKSNDVSCGNDSAILIASGGSYYTWYPNLFITRNNGDRITVKPTQTTTYTVMSTDGFGCKGKDSVTVAFLKEGEQRLFVPSAFTPNGDGLNDVFRPVFIGPSAKYDFRIYNRWGQLIFHSKTPGQGWDGTYKGVPQRSDVFVYYLIAEGGCNGEFKQKGTIALIR